MVNVVNLCTQLSVFPLHCAYRLQLLWPLHNVPVSPDLAMFGSRHTRFAHGEAGSWPHAQQLLPQCAHRCVSLPNSTAPRTPAPVRGGEHHVQGHILVAQSPPLS